MIYGIAGEEGKKSDGVDVKISAVGNISGHRGRLNPCLVCLHYVSSYVRMCRSHPTVSIVRLNGSFGIRVR